VIGTEALGWGRFQEPITIWPQFATGSLNKDILRLLRSHVWRERNKTGSPIRKITYGQIRKRHTLWPKSAPARPSAVKNPTAPFARLAHGEAAVIGHYP
jgi:hypothetical protein